MTESTSVDSPKVVTPRKQRKPIFTKARGYAALFIFAITGVLALIGVGYTPATDLFVNFMWPWLAMGLYALLCAIIIYVLGLLAWREIMSEHNGQLNDAAANAYAQGREFGNREGSSEAHQQWRNAGHTNECTQPQTSFRAPSYTPPVPPKAEDTRYVSADRTWVGAVIDQAPLETPSAAFPRPAKRNPMASPATTRTTVRPPSDRSEQPRKRNPMDNR